MSDPSTSPRASREVVLAGAVPLGLVALALRGWVLAGSWFTTDDHRVARTALTERWAALLTPFDDRFVPLLRAGAWAMTRSGHESWGTATAVSMTLQAAATVAALCALVAWCGWRPGVLVPFALYLTSAVAVPGTLAWSSALVWVPLQIAVFGAAACWALLLRTGRTRWTAGVVACVVLGLLSGPHGLLVPVVLVLLAAHRDGVRAAFAQARVAVSLVAALVLGYGALTLWLAPPQPGWPGAADAVDLVGNLLGRALPTALVGGPWQWSALAPPASLADPAWVGVAAAWLLLVGTAASLARSRVRTGRSWLLVAVVALVDGVALIVDPAASLGTGIGLDLSFGTDVLPVAVLGLALAWLGVPDGPRGSAPRPARTSSHATRPGVPVPLTVLSVAAVLVGGLVSSALYADTWRSDDPGEAYLTKARSWLVGAGPTDLADQVVPEQVVPALATPANTTAFLLPLLVSEARFPAASDDLFVLDASGRPVPAAVSSVATSGPGPRSGCGWRIGRRGTSVPLDRTTTDGDWWLRIGYLSGGDTTVEITAGSTVAQAARVAQGLGTLYVRVEGAVGRVTIRPAAGDSDTGLCVDSVDLGEAVPAP
ncbi:hypothetical protein [Nocardioides acrostichi]|uniref:Uncharacterized protein n=1 Tax=Nocardioides acrostichi TaxID=2784339 RepID=A0A930V1B2_9ACTN|nr:hypothetical protein [Nocardioides acrostichi]MBF4161910.1 hypothetical protein [Nocardioides acrostichi]